MHSLKTLAAAAAVLFAFPALAQNEPKPAPKPKEPAAKQPAEKPKEKAKEATTKLAKGDKAPALSAEKWVNGSEVAAFEKGHVYVVEFWATWCPPCQKSIPHLSELQKEYKDKKVTIIGVDVWEDAHGGKYDAEMLKKVEKFVKDKGDKMQYTVAYDGGGKKMDHAYMQAAGQDGIPAAFIVDGEGKIAWIGNPLNPSFDTELKKIAGAGDKEKKKDKDAAASKSGG